MTDHQRDIEHGDDHGDTTPSTPSTPAEPSPSGTSSGGAGTDLETDLVLDGGGVKGIALVGAVKSLVEAGYSFRRIAGTSAGAIVAAVLAAMAQAGEPLTRIEELAATLDYAKFTDRRPVASAVGKLADPLGLGRVVDAIEVLLHSGAHPGRYLRDWVHGRLADLGVERFGDLRLPEDVETDLPQGHRYRLVVIVSDVSNHRMARFPWDYRDYGLDPDEQVIADAVRASASVPYFFEPVTLATGPRTGSTLVDGGLLSSFPITTFDRTDGRLPRWPTLGVRLAAKDAKPTTGTPVVGPLKLAGAAVETMMNARDSLYLAEPCNQRRTAFVAADDGMSLDFDIDPATRDELLHAGERAMTDFLATWDFRRYLHECRGGPQ